MSYTCNNCGKKENPCIFDDTAEGAKPHFCPVDGEALTTWKKIEAKPADPRRYEIAKGIYHVFIKDEDNGIYNDPSESASYALMYADALIDDLDKTEAAK